MAATQFITNADSATVDPSKSVFHSATWFQDVSKDYSPRNQPSWNQSPVYSDTPGHTISYYPYASCQPAYGSNSLQPDAVWSHENPDQATIPGSQEADQLTWGGFGAGYYPAVAEFRDGETVAGTDYSSSDWSSWTCLARTMDPGCWGAGSSLIVPRRYQTPDDLAQYAVQCVKQEADDRDVIKHANGSTAVTTSFIYQVGK